MQCESSRAYAAVLLWCRRLRCRVSWGTLLHSSRPTVCVQPYHHAIYRRTRIAKHLSVMKIGYGNVGFHPTNTNKMKTLKRCV